MPVFDYRCPKCGRVYKDVYVTDFNATMLCKERNITGDCNGVLKKLLSAPNVIFKGSGWTEKFYGNQEEEKT